METAQRKIIHIDMDAFYASVEQRDHPELRGKPVIVGGQPGGRGVVMTCSYEARALGVRSAMPSGRAFRLCPQAHFVPPRFEVYKAVSRQIREIFHRYTDLVEPVSLDEAYLDVTENKPGIRSAIFIAGEIRKKIREETGLTATAGVSYCKFLAKMASGLNKPDGLSFLSPEDGPRFLATLPVGKFHGIGEATARRLRDLGLHTGADLVTAGEAFLRTHFGKTGAWYYRIAQGIDHRSVSPDRETKSVSAEDTFARDSVDMAQMDSVLQELAFILARRLERSGLQGRTLTLKVKYADFRIISRSRSLPQAFSDAETLATNAQELLRHTAAGTEPVRLLGIGLSNLSNRHSPTPPAPPASPQLSLPL